MPEFREDKLAALIAYMASRSADDKHFGVVKAAKLVTFADFAAYKRWGEPITNAQYIKLPAGPVPRQYDATLNMLKARGQIRVKEGFLGRRKQRRILPTPAAEWSALTDQELALADELLRRYREDTATDLRELSHQLPGWALVELKHEIPYHTAFITLDGPSERDYKDSEALAARFGWS